MNKLWLAVALASPLIAQNADTWKFAVSGDSRNCGDIVMPAIAAGVIHDGASFYWHLGDFRAIYTFDEDLVKPQNIITYETTAWPDFIAHQLAPFGNLPIYLTPGNHETIPPASRDAYLTQFADWLVTPTFAANASAATVLPTTRSALTWTDRNIDFIALDNASHDEFSTTRR